MNSRRENARSVDPKTLRVALYARRSCAEEGGRNRSVQEQIDRCREICRYLGYNHEAARAFAEQDGVKGDWWWEGAGPAPHRPQLSHLMRAVESGQIDVIVCWRLDRLCRDVRIALELADRLREYGVILIAGTKQIDLLSADGEFQYITEAAANTKYRQRIAEDIKRDHDFKASVGMLTRNPACYGFRSAGRSSQALVPVWEEIEVVRRIYKLFLEGEDLVPLSPSQIARKLMAEGIRVRVGSMGHRVRYPDLIEAVDIVRILTNGRYAGLWKHAGDYYDCELLHVARDGSPREPVVSRSTFEAVQARLQSTKIAGKRAMSSEYLVSGMLVCHSCGRPMVAGKSRPRADGYHRRTYVCSNKQAGRQGLCPVPSVTIQVDVIDDWVLAHLIPDIRMKIEESRRSGGDDDLRQLAHLEVELTQARQRETKELADLMSVLDTEQFGALSRTLRAKREELARRVADVRSRIEARSSAFPDLSDDVVRSMQTPVLKSALQRCVKFITPTPEGLVVCDMWDGYLGARWSELVTGKKLRGKKRLISPPTIEATLDASSWIEDPERFLVGRRLAQGKSAHFRTDEELVPGIERFRVEQLEMGDEK